MSQGVNASEVAELEAPSTPANPEHGLPENFGTGLLGTLLFWIAVSFSTFQIITAFGIPLDHSLIGGISMIHIIGAGFVVWAAWLVVLRMRGRNVMGGLLGLIALAVTYGLILKFPGSLPSQVVRTLHVGFLCLVAGAMLANHKAHTPLAKAFGWAVGLLGFAIGLYHWALYEELLIRSGELTQLDLVVGIAAIAVLFYLVWRVMGPALPIVAGIFLAYCLFGNYLPAPFDHRGYSLEQVIEHMSFGTEGLYATPTLVSATYIFLFILFGAFLERAGMIQLFTDIAMGAFGGARGGPAKVAVFSSALMGTISGSGVANVVSTGQFTIPLMKRFGYKPEFAGGVEATASMGGQIMPPVMGAVAFIMAETIDVPYVEIVKAAIIPAILYYASAFLAVHLEAGKSGLMGLARSELPSAWRALREKWHLILPLAVLVYLLFSGYTPLFAGSIGLALTVVLILAGALAMGLVSETIRLVFWVGLGLLAAAFLWAGVTLVLVLVAALVVISLFVRGGPETLEACRDALADGARQALPVGLACAVVGIVIGTMTLTGIGTIFGNWVVSIGRDSLILSLVLTMFVSLVLGMGIPTIPNYIITSSLAAPALLTLGVPLIVSHMFVFYFGIMADLTPPVALAAFAAAPIAKASGFKIGFQALRIALPGFVIPYMAVYDPTLMMQPVAGLEGWAFWASVAYMVVKAGLAVLLWGIASVGYFRVRMPWWERIGAAIAAGFLVLALPITDEIGFGLAALVIGFHYWRNRQAPAVAAGR
ncbi:TRAP transporter permease [Microvirga subterranea]|uniref:TRAP transporter 4TM/12TM fusion protein n=1 Tax=Microvirga subterranea TaxID=186651 RepID=A0A370HI58_9HYPH|nr:TRAP transporter permease [Microvirga subterranea]RDI57117.1 TRAP transporter 4TM/12TM fusion protein [Microvirga subterranea]